MEKENKIDNSIFISVFAGVVLLIASIGISLISAKVPYMVMSASTGLSSLLLLMNAIKKDKESFSGHQDL